MFIPRFIGQQGSFFLQIGLFKEKIGGGGTPIERLSCFNTLPREPNARYILKPGSTLEAGTFLVGNR